jgi:hypothetical protein
LTSIPTIPLKGRFHSGATDNLSWRLTPYGRRSLRRNGAGFGRGTGKLRLSPGIQVFGILDCLGTGQAVYLKYWGTSGIGRRHDRKYPVILTNRLTARLSCYCLATPNIVLLKSLQIL